MACILAVGWYLRKKSNKKRIDELRKKTDILTDHFQLLNHWLEIKNEGKSSVLFFESMGYRHIAIYGMAELANRLSEDLDGSDISIDYGIDRDICCSIARIDEVYFPEDSLPETDVIVVTPYYSFESIKSILERQVSCPIISLEDVIWSV